MITLPKKQQELLWWKRWPYSEAKLVFESRISNDHVSSTYINVVIAINPTTFAICKDHIDQFADNPSIQNILYSAQYYWEKQWYIIRVYSEKYDPASNQELLETLEEARKVLQISEKCVIEMHECTIDFLWI